MESFMKRTISTGIGWLLSVLASLAALDVACETLLAGSPMRVPAIVVAIAVVAIVVFGRRIDAIVLGAVVASLFGALLEYQGFTLGTIASENGLRIVGHSGDVLGAALAAGLLTSIAILLVISSRIPVVLRVVCAAAIVYAVVPLGFALAHGTGLTTALATNAPLTGGPNSLYGAYLASLVVFPGTTVAFLVAAIAFAIRKRGRASARFAAAALSCAVVTQTCGVEALNAGYPIAVAFRAPVGARSAGAVTVTPQTAGRAGDEIDRQISALPKTSYDISEEAAVLGSGIAPAFSYVRDRIRYESYSGMMRGYDETFTARAGNAIDRTVLLGHFLAMQKIPVRIAVGKLTPRLAEVLFDHMFDNASPAPTVSRDALTTRVFVRAHRDYAAIQAALGPFPTPLASYDRTKVLSEIEDHAWLQAQVNGTWTDLDTSFPDATPGRAYATVEHTYGDVQPDMKQHVTIRVLADYVENGTLSTESALEQVFDAPDLLDREVFLGTSGVGGPREMGSTGGPVGPMLLVGGDGYGGKAIDFEPAAPIKTPFGAAAGAFGGTPAPSANPIAGGRQFVAERLEVETDTPDGSTSIVSRTLVDRAGDAWRASSNHDATTLRALPKNADGLLATQTTFNLCFSAGDHDLIAYGNALSALAHGFSPANTAATPAPLTAQQALWPIAVRDLAWTIFSDHVVVPSLNDTPGLRFYADRPRVFVFADRPNASGEGMTLESDLRSDTLRGVARATTDADAVGAHKVLFGALEGAMEHELIAEQSGDPANAIVASTSALLGSDGAVVARRDMPADLGAVSAETAARIDTALASGDTLVISRAVLRGGGASGWWEIAKTTGDTRAVFGDDLNGGTSFNGRWASAGPSTWGPKGSLPLNSPYSAGAPGPKKGGGGGEIGEYVAMLQTAVENASTVQRLTAAVIGAIGLGSSVLIACAPV
jgi:hypothetical protein